MAGQPIRVKDIDGDGRLDLVGMLIHEEGDLPGTKAAAFWMKYKGLEPRANNWTTHVIKWGSGKTMMLAGFGFGEKWDQVNFADVDRDGDQDIVANCEEWWEDDIEFRLLGSESRPAECRRGLVREQAATRALMFSANRTVSV